MWDALQFEGEKVVSPLLPHGQKKDLKQLKVLILSKYSYSLK